MLSKANFLILDEPTNHLDMISKEILESALTRYTGTVFFVSHDRYFINKTATRILDLTKQTLVNYIGNYDYYLEKHDTQMQAVQSAEILKPAEQKNESSKESWLQQRQEQAKARKKASALKRAEDEIAQKEAFQSQLEEELNLPENASNSAELNEIHTKLTEISKELETLYEVWETLAEDV